MIKVLKTGIQSSIQDFGRTGYRNLGVPLSGCMDRQSAIYANTIVGNQPQTALIEFALAGPSLEFLNDTTIALTGAYFDSYIDDVSVNFGKPISIKKGSILAIGPSKNGNFGYLAIRGGLKAEYVLGSYSQYAGITEYPGLQKNQKIEFLGTPEDTTPILNSSIKSSFVHFNSDLILVDQGPEFRLFSEEEQLKLLGHSYTLLPTSNRMAFVTDVSDVKGKGIITSPVMPGTVQLTSAGKLFILMRDAQTTGGYSRILQLPPNAIDQLSQRSFGQTIRFKLR